MDTITGIAGVAGAVLIWAAYFAVVRHWLSARSMTYAVLSLAGAVLVLPWLLVRPAPVLILVLLAALALLLVAHLLRSS